MPTGAAAREAAERPDHVDPALSHASDEALAQGIFAFARGARAGSCLHEILENCDFATTGSPATEALVRRTLERHGLLDDSAHEGPIQPQREVLAMLDHVTSSRLPGSDFALCSVDATRRLNEWQFYLPMGAVSQGDIAETLAKHGSSAIRDDYPRRLRALGARKIEGFLTGFVDLVFTDGKRWYVVDWKSNHLGNDTRAYAHNALAEAMDEHHYVLQYHLYVLALHRHLASRLRGYEYERDFGGVYYAFLRGIRAEAGTGWYHDRPPWPLVEALDTLIGGRKAA